ncbi:MAG: hypothetical protein II304_07615 [Bacteroidales bacterium]|jgi:hypothetical protein|nr:hypothetical protein [Bacteroidales bacterium]
MSKFDNIVKLAVDACNKVPSAFAEGNPSDVIRNALIEANGGSSKLDYRAIRDGKCDGLFELVETLINATVYEGLPTASPIFDFIEYKNGALGDKPEFYVPDNSLLTVDVIASGTQGIRRQRIADGREVTLTPMNKTIKIYEELDRVLAGRIDWLEFVNRVSKSFIANTYADIATAFNGLYSQVAAPYAITGTFSEASLLELIDHVEAKTGKAAKIVGTRMALRKISMEVTGADIEGDYYNFGFAGKFNGTPCFRMINGHKNGTNDFIINDTDILVVAGDDKFIKHYTEGDALIIPGEPTNNADLTQEYTVIDKNATTIVLADTVGVYRIS